MITHSFETDLAYSHSQADAPYWRPIYQRAFPTMRDCFDTRQDGWQQHAGIDRVVTLRDSTQILIDEKVRRDDWPDILLEIWSDWERKKPGWARKDMRCDYIAYAFEPSHICYLLPFLPLRRVVEEQRVEWWAAGSADRDGFHIRRANNLDRKTGRAWVTVSLAVPTEVLLDALRDTMVIRW